MTKTNNNAEYRRLYTEEGFCPEVLGDSSKCVCRDCIFRLKYSGESKNAKYIKEYNELAITKCVCSKFNNNQPHGLQTKPEGIIENNEQCEYYEKE